MKRITNEQRFWHVDHTDKKSKLDIDKHRFVLFLEKQGFANFSIGGELWTIRIENNVIKKIKPHDVLQFIREYIDSLPNDLGNGYTSTHLHQIFHNKMSGLTYTNQLLMMKVINPATVKDSKTKCYKFFKNCCVLASSDKLKTIQYSELDSFVWEHDILDRDFHLLDPTEVYETCNFYKFLYLCMGQNQERLCSLISLFGYLLNTYKNSAEAKAIVFCDEVNNGNPDGGSGKSLTALAISKLINTALEDGKVFDPSSSFTYQQVDFDTNLIWIDDAEKKFRFEKLFTTISTGIIVEKKYQLRYTIPFEDAPKLLITTNYMIEGIGNSFERRKIEIEFSNYFNKERQPEDVFGHRFFDDWNADQWNCFDNLMILFIQYFINSGGIIEPPMINLTNRKVIQETNLEFKDYADKLPRNTKLNKNNIYNDFIALYPEHHDLAQRSFTTYLRIYAHYAQDVYKLNESRADATRCVTIETVK